MLNKISLNIKDFWLKSVDRKSLTLGPKIFFLILCFLEFFYRISFFVVQCIKKNFGQKSVSEFKVISVGNLTVGGTGKTVFIQILASFLGVENCAILSRGYGSASSNKNLLVCDGNNIFHGPDVCGDEPFMLAKILKSTVVTGANRYKSCLMLRDLSEKIKYILLDDGYQNLQLKKNFEVLLIDARYPLGFNAHCLPAGNLRECDYSRADVIILTHAEMVTVEQIGIIKNKIFSQFNSSNIFSGKHRAVGLFQADCNLVNSEYFDNKKFILAAGVGSFSGLVESIKNFGANISEYLEFKDHHNYSREDVDKILQKVTQNNLNGVIVTQKDWVKLFPIISENELQYFFIFKIEFEFLSQAEYSLFIDILSSKLR